MRKLRDKLRAARMKMNISQEKLAELAEISTRSVVRLETEDCVPRRKTIELLAEVLNVSTEYLTDDSTDIY